jgi:hypothetical protein
VPPPISDSFDDWQLLYRRFAACLEDIRLFSLELAGLTLNLEKGALLVPVGAPLPIPEVRELFHPQFEFHAFMRSFVQAKVNEAASKLSMIKLVGKKSPRAAHRLITSCATKLMSFLAATVPPHISCSEFLLYDKLVEQVFFDLISPAASNCHELRSERARLKASLPTPYGCGLFNGVLFPPASKTLCCSSYALALPASRLRRGIF